MNLDQLYWSRIVNFIIQNYLQETTLCILWNNDLEFELMQPEDELSYTAIINMDTLHLGQSFQHNVIDFETKAQQLHEKGLKYDDFMLKIAVSIETSHCESFLVSGRDIPVFAGAFSRASMYSIWRSMRTKFLFAYYADDMQENYFKNFLFQDQPNILLIESIYRNATVFNLKTNKYVGPLSEGPEQMYLLKTFDAVNEVFDNEKLLYPDKTHDLQGRELTIATFDYRPYSVLNYDLRPNTRDVGASDPKLANVYIDGTELRYVMQFCTQFNCTVQLDTSDASDWGTIYPNMSGDGAMGMIISHKAEICIGAMYSWYDDYIYLDMSMYLVRSGITCLVPAPRPQASWLLPLQPFNALLWVFVILCLLIESFSLMSAYMSENLLYKDNKHTWLISLKFAFVTTFKLFISQSGSSPLRSVSIRFLLFACFLNDIIITSIYGGGLASILTIPRMEEAADSLERLRSHKLKWAANSEAWVSAIRASDDPLVQDVLANFYIYTDEELYELAKTERMGFTLERLPFGHYAIESYLTSDVIDHMKLMTDDVYFQYTVAFVPRLWPLLESFNRLVYNWHSSGFDKYWEFRVVGDNLNVHLQQQVESTLLSSYEDIGPMKLNLSNFVGILAVWVLGITIAILCFLGEIFLNKIQNHLIVI